MVRLVCGFKHRRGRSWPLVNLLMAETMLLDLDQLLLQSHEKETILPF